MDNCPRDYSGSKSDEFAKIIKLLIEKGARKAYHTLQRAPVVPDPGFLVDRPYLSLHRSASNQVAKILAQDLAKQENWFLDTFLSRCERFEDFLIGPQVEWRGFLRSTSDILQMHGDCFVNTFGS